jgi:glycosyltransferase involved in cell wall biosynthesis
LKNRGLADDRLIYIPNSILVDKLAERRNSIRDRFHIPHQAFLIGTAGRLSIEKNQEMLIKSAIRILTGHPSSDIRFILAGEGPRHDELAAMIPDAFRDKIILAGWIEDNDAFYADLDLFVLTSKMEGFPNVLLEAGKYNLPAISTPAGGATEIIQDAQSGFLIPFNDSEALVRAITAVYEDNPLRQKLGRALGQVTRSKFEAGANAAKFLDFVERKRAPYE